MSLFSFDWFLILLELGHRCDEVSGGLLLLEPARHHLPHHARVVNDSQPVPAAALCSPTVYYRYQQGSTSSREVSEELEISLATLSQYTGRPCVVPEVELPGEPAGLVAPQRDGGAAAALPGEVRRRTVRRAANLTRKVYWDL